MVDRSEQDCEEILRNSTNKSIPDFSVNGLCALCKVVDIYDADTFRVVFFIDKEDKEPIKLKVRADGYNAAEMHPLKSHPDREEEMRKARVARNRLIQLVSGIDMDINDTKQFSNSDVDKILDENKKLMYIKFGKFDKYGRVLGVLYLNPQDEISINQILIDENHAVFYDGGKRNKNKLTIENK